MLFESVLHAMITYSQLLTFIKNKNQEGKKTHTKTNAMFCSYDWCSLCVAHCSCLSCDFFFGVYMIKTKIAYIFVWKSQAVDIICYVRWKKEETCEQMTVVFNIFCVYVCVSSIHLTLNVKLMQQKTKWTMIRQYSTENTKQTEITLCFLWTAYIYTAMMLNLCAHVVLTVVFSRCRLNWILTHTGQKQNYGTCYKFAYESVNVTFSRRIFYELDGKNYDIFFLYRLIIFTLAAMTLDLCEQDHPERRVLLWQIDEWTNRRRKKKWNKIK